MADYPSVSQHEESNRRHQSGIVFERTDDGAGRARSLWATPKVQLRMVHELSHSDAQLVRDHFYAHIASTFTINYNAESPATAYTVMYSSAGIVEDQWVGPDWTRIVTELEEV